MCGPAVAAEHFPVAPLRCAVTRGKPDLEAEGLVVEHDGQLEAAFPEAGREQREVGHVKNALVEAGNGPLAVTRCEVGAKPRHGAHDRAVGSLNRALAESIVKLLQVITE